MSWSLFRRVPKRALRRASPSSLLTIHGGTLTLVVGGRITPRTTMDPVLQQGFQQLAEAVQSVGQNMAAAKQSGTQQMMQMVQQRMQGGGGH